MSVRMVDLHGMIQNTNEVAAIKHQENNKANLQQQNIQNQFAQQIEQASAQVRQLEETQQEEYRYQDGKSGASDYQENKKKKKKKEHEIQKDGKVINKAKQHSFDMKI